jgi:(E)-4-hydroxy-3-methylbut-2-enyl-diphosphate synthase
MSFNNYKYCESLTEFKRFKTRVVNIGNIPLGGENPIRIQSMTTTDTMDTLATVEQTIRLAEAGCEYVRITAPSQKEAENLAEIKKELKKRGYDVPLIADIHYTPKAAEIAARIVEKVRVNPGNYVDKKKFLFKDYSDAEYAAEIERIRERFTPLVKICKEYGTAIRIGSNHGSLSDRILSRYGDTPEGMVESALEFVNICRENNFHDIVISMKASNTRIMVAAYRLLTARMLELGMDYPIHLGVTEAGDGLDGRVKSAVGIGALLEDGIGDTIRVSLTEPPEAEIPVAKLFVERYSARKNSKKIPELKTIVKNPFEYKKRETFAVAGFGGKNRVAVVADFTSQKSLDAKSLSQIGVKLSESGFEISDGSPDFIASKKTGRKTELVALRSSGNTVAKCLPVVEFGKTDEKRLRKPVAIRVNVNDVFSENFKRLENHKNAIFVLYSDNENFVAEIRRIFFEFDLRNVRNPVVIYNEYDFTDTEKLAVYAATDFGALLLEGYGDGIWIKAKNVDAEKSNELAFAILQAARVRISKTEYIACPSCGRTLFDLVEVTNKIRERTSHLVGVKIGIMGCIVNGPGEMADADYGYVGAGPGKITLYKGREVVKRNVPAEIAVDELIALIKENGDWREPES